MLRRPGAEAVVADLRGDVECTAEGCNAAVFTAAARRRSELGSIDAGGAQADNPPDDPKMIEPDAAPLDADVEWVGDGPVPPARRQRRSCARGSLMGQSNYP